ncbi:hypothetical protein BDV93DRAFT_611513 [Ceratobasidium sp. AG-I]|nr:hypothetical protein BDV93DRAFT_611513 [Ceratobasidium sp. AG-I]
MATIQTRPFSGNYSGLVTQAAIASVILAISITSFELIRRKRRKIPTQTNEPGVLGSVDSWEFGYLYQGRCWAKVPAPALPPLPLSWVRQVLLIREPDLFRLVGTDATVYTRFLVGCVFFITIHVFTTLPVLLPLHVTHAPPSIPPRSMVRASLSSLIDSSAFGGDKVTWRGNLRLLSVHCALLWWLSLTWIGTLLWICRGAFRLREAMVQDAKRSREKHLAENNGTEHPEQGWRLRTIMVTNIPSGLRDDDKLAHYFKSYMSKQLEISPLAPVLAPSPGILSFAVNRLWRWGKSAAIPLSNSGSKTNSTCEGEKEASTGETGGKPDIQIEKVALVRKTTELASIFERREDVLKRLEHAHIKLANKVLLAVKHKMQNPDSRRSPISTPPDAVVAASFKHKARANSKSGTLYSDSDQPSSSNDAGNKTDSATPIPYALASPRVRSTLPRVTVAPATPPDTPRNDRSGFEMDEMGNMESPSRRNRIRDSDSTEYYTPATPTRPALPHRPPPPIPPRSPQTPNRNGGGVRLVTPGYGTPLTSPAFEDGASGSANGASLGVVLATPGFGTPPVSPRTEAAEMGYNVRSGTSSSATGSLGAYGEGLGLGLPSLGRGAKGSMGPRAVRASDAPSMRGKNREEEGFGSRMQEEAERPARGKNPRRPSERPLIEPQSDQEMDGVLVDRRGPIERNGKQRESMPVSRDVFFDAVSGSPRDRAIERNKRLVEAIGPFVYEFGLLERPVVQSKSPRPSGNDPTRAGSSDSNESGKEGPESPLRPPVPLYQRMSSGSSWFSAFSSNNNSHSRTISQSTGQTLVNPPALGFSAQVLRTHTLSVDGQLYGPNGVREVRPGETLWDALHSLPREDLDAYQPLIHLSALFRGQTVPAIDFLTTKLAFLSTLIHESRSTGGGCEPPASTAFVTFRDPRDARRATKELAAHPKNMMACVVTPAPDVRDIDWGRAMKSAYTGEFLKDWVVNAGVWGFTVLWIFPVSLFVGLVSIDRLSEFLPGLDTYLETHRIQKELLSSFLPTLLVALLAILIPLLLLLIAKKAHNIITFSRLHDRILTRYYKFLVCNVVIFFCFGVSALQSFLTSFGEQLTNVVTLVASDIPLVAPFFVGWLIFQTGIHAGLELGLFGLPLIVYPAMVRGATTPRRREFGTRARTFNYYYWLPNHLLVIIITLLFSLLNPLIIPFSLLYFLVALAVFKHQFVHVYRKIYDGNAENLVIRILRYSLDGLMLTQVVLMAVMLLLQQSIQAGVVGTALCLTALTKLYLTRLTRAKFEAADIAEANAACGIGASCSESEEKQGDGQPEGSDAGNTSHIGRVTQRMTTWHSPPNASHYSTLPRVPEHRPANPFKPQPPPLPPRPISVESPIRPTYLAPPPRPVPRLSRLASWETFQGGCPLVVDYPEREPWDDTPDHTATYDNPYYKQPVHEYLWLPKNPLSELDLNHTIKMHRALTAEVACGDMAESVFLDDEAAAGSIHEDMTINPFDEITGNENIALSSVILDRVDHGDLGDDFDLAEISSTSTFSRRPSAGTYASRRSRRRSSTAFRSFSAGIRRSGANLLAPMSPSRLRSHSVGVGLDPALQPNLNVQAQFLPSEARLAPPTLRRLASAISIGRRSEGRRSHDDTPARPNRPRANTGASTALSVREALLREVCEEERTATEERIRQELQESEQFTSHHKWTGWMYSKPTSNGHDTPL